MQGKSFAQTPRTLIHELRLPSILLTAALTALYANVAGAGAAETASNPVPTTASVTASMPPALPSSIYQQEPAAPVTVPAPTASQVASARPMSSNALPAAFVKGAEGLSPKILRAALNAMSGARARGVSGRDDLLTVIDYSLPSSQPRLWVLDLDRGKVLYRELVAHGAGSGDLYATRFSNVNDSRQTSLGLFLTEGTYEGGNGYSLRLRGLDTGVNDRAGSRNIVMHGAWYVSDDHIRQFGRIGRSWGCPALPAEEAPRVIDTIKGGTFIYSYAGPGAAARKSTTVLASNVAKGRSAKSRATFRTAAAATAARLGAAVLPGKTSKTKR
jgi:hypothetical protein